jgi:hypothetical protein
MDVAGSARQCHTEKWDKVAEKKTVLSAAARRKITGPATTE